MLDGIQVFSKIAELEPKRINQMNGYYKHGSSCCVGAYLAHYLDSEKLQSDGYYKTGIAEWARVIGGNELHVILLLRQSGAGHDPFSEEPWENSVKEVWENLQKIETLPETKGGNFARMHLGESDLSGADLRDADLSYCYLSYTNLAGSDLTGAYLTGADLTGVDLTGAKLTDAKLTDSELTGAKLANADLTGANFIGADLAGVKLTDEQLTDVDLTEAKLTWD